MAHSSPRRTKAKSRSTPSRAASRGKATAGRLSKRTVAKRATAMKKAPASKAKARGSAKKAAVKRASLARKAAGPKKKAAAAKPKKKVAAAKPKATRAPVKRGLSAKNAEVLSRASARVEVEGLLSRLPPPVAPIMKTLRELVLEAAPEAVERLEGDTASYFAGGMFASIKPMEREVLLNFVKGARLPSSIVLKRKGGAAAVALSSIDSVRASVLRTLVREAVMLNLEKSPLKKRG